MLQGGYSLKLPNLCQHRDDKENILSFYLEIIGEKSHDCCWLGFSIINPVVYEKKSTKKMLISFLLKKWISRKKHS